MSVRSSLGRMVWMAQVFPLFCYVTVTVAGSCFEHRKGEGGMIHLGEWESYCFAFFSSLFTWAESRKLCHSYNAELVRITGSELQDFIVDKVVEKFAGRPKHVSFWLGARDESQTNDWRWENGDAVEWTDWSTSPETGTCAMYDGVSDRWWKIICDTFADTVCQKDLPSPKTTTESQDTTASSPGVPPTSDLPSPETTTESQDTTASSPGVPPTSETTEETFSTQTSVLPVVNRVERPMKKKIVKQKYQRHRYFTVARGKRLLSAPWASTKGWSIMACSGQCRAEDSCVLANFDRRRKTCNLYTTMSALKQEFAKDDAWYVMEAKV